MVLATTAEVASLTVRAAIDVIEHEKFTAGWDALEKAEIDCDLPRVTVATPAEVASPTEAEKQLGLILERYLLPLEVQDLIRPQGRSI